MLNTVTRSSIQEHNLGGLKFHLIVKNKLGLLRAQMSRLEIVANILKIICMFSLYL